MKIKSIFIVAAMLFVGTFAAGNLQKVSAASCSTWKSGNTGYVKCWDYTYNFHRAIVRCWRLAWPHYTGVTGQWKESGQTSSATCPTGYRIDAVWVGWQF